MPSLYTEIEISAPKSVVWQALIQKEAWSKWNTFLFDRTPEQPFKLGQTLLLSLRRLSGETETEFQARVTVVQPESCLQWVATAPGFKNEHVFELQEVGWQRTKYTHRENYSGLITHLVLPMMRQDEQQGLRRMARELKQYVER
jgi:hypothetical protein